MAFTVLNSASFVHQRENNWVSGADADLVRYVARGMNFTYTLVICKAETNPCPILAICRYFDGEGWGSEDKSTGQWDGAVGKVVANVSNVQQVSIAIDLSYAFLAK